MPTSGRGSEGVSSLRPPDDCVERRRVTVPLCPLDELGIDDVGFVKIDVEGHEIEVLRGARETLVRQQPTVLVEIEQRFHAEPIEAAFRELTGLGYDGYFFSRGRWRALAEFTVEKHQRAPLESAEPGGYVAHSLLGHQGYVNNFLFRADGMP